MQAFRISATELSAISAWLRSCAVPIVKDGAVLGTGTLVRAGSVLLLVTAAHVVRAAKAKGMLIPCDPGAQDWINLSGSRVVFHDKGNKDPDCAVVVLSKEVSAAIRGRAVLSLDDIASLEPMEHTTTLFAGFPVVETPTGRERARVFVSERTPRNIDEFVDEDGAVVGRDEALHLFLTHTKAVTRIGGEGSQVIGPDLRGVSGTSVWIFRDRSGNCSGLWNPTTQLSVIGVLIGYAEGSWIRVTYWNQIVTLLHAHLEEVRSVIELRFGVPPSPLDT